jgi:hypothetical protein
MVVQEGKSTSEQLIRIRSYLLWERDGCPQGRSEEYWFRAKSEIDEETDKQWRAIGFEAEMVRFVPPRPAIAQRPVRIRTA